MVSILVDFVFSIPWDTSCLLWVRVSSSTTVDSNYEVLGRRLPLNEQNDCHSGDPPSGEDYCHNAASNE